MAKIRCPSSNPPGESFRLFSDLSELSDRFIGKKAKFRVLILGKVDS